MSWTTCCGGMLRVTEEQVARRESQRIVRDVTREPFYAHTGKQAGSSIRTVWASGSQLKLVLFAFALYGMSAAVIYGILSSALVYISFHNIPEDSPSHPFSHHQMPLYDVGFASTPDSAHSCYSGWSTAMGTVKDVFLDSGISACQWLPYILLPLFGHTQRLVCFAGCLAVGLIGKGIVQILTILPSSQGGWKCWTPGERESVWTHEMLNSVRESPFSAWFYKGWGLGNGCNDMLWSGHAFQITLALLFFNGHLGRIGVGWLPRSLLLFYYLAYVFVMLACRLHYTTDIVLGTAVAALVFTHTGYRFWFWRLANRLVRNEPYPNECECAGLRSLSAETSDRQQSLVSSEESPA